MFYNTYCKFHAIRLCSTLPYTQNRWIDVASLCRLKHLKEPRHLHLPQTSVIKFMFLVKQAFYGGINTVNRTCIVHVFNNWCYIGNTFRQILVIFRPYTRVTSTKIVLIFTECKWPNYFLKSNVTIYVHIPKYGADICTQYWYLSDVYELE